MIVLKLFLGTPWYQMRTMLWYVDDDVGVSADDDDDDDDDVILMLVTHFVC